MAVIVTVMLATPFNVRIVVMLAAIVTFLGTAPNDSESENCNDSCSDDLPSTVIVSVVPPPGLRSMVGIPELTALTRWLESARFPKLSFDLPPERPLTNPSKPPAAGARTRTTPAPQSPGR